MTEYEIYNLVAEARNELADLRHTFLTPLDRMKLSRIEDKLDRALEDLLPEPNTSL